MLFSSIFFLYFFLPIMLLLYAFVPDRGKNIVLLISSILFYAWGEPKYIVLMLAQIMISYVLTCFMDKYRDKWFGKLCLVLSVAIPFLALIFFKYSSFLLEDVFGIEAGVLTDLRKLALPIGISFYTFQIVSYNVDVWNKKVPCQHNLLTLATYVTLFPQLVAGPIVRYADVDECLQNKSKCTQERFEDFEYGVLRFVTGLGKKVLIANILGEFVVETGGLSSRSIALSWAYALAVGLQVYFDFSGYSDMAIGLGAMLGFRFPENFRYPFISKSISEFWRRWHITLGSWFRDYVYIPMGGNRVSFLRWCFNIFVVWMFTGLWHGADWNFILWGLYFAVFLFMEKLMAKAGKVIFDKFMVSNKYVCISGMFIKHIYVLLTVMVSFLVFHNTDLNNLVKDIRSLFEEGIYPITDINEAIRCGYILKNRIGILLVALVGSTPLPAQIWDRVKTHLPQIVESIIKMVYTIALLLICTAYLIDGSYNPFLYFRF